MQKDSETVLTSLEVIIKSLLFNAIKPECTCMIEYSSENARTVQGHCEVKILPNWIFKTPNPIVVEGKVEEGTVKVGTPYTISECE